MKDKGQSAIEFIILVAAVLFFFMIFTYAIQVSISDKAIEKKRVLVKDTALTIQDEINLAHESSDGYYRDFRIPLKMANSDYEISVVEGLVYLRTLDGKYAIAYPVAEVNGQPLKGDNFIRKEAGQVYLNS